MSFASAFVTIWGVFCYIVVVVAVGYTTTDVIYRWNRARQVAIAEDMKLSQFDLIATPSDNQTDTLPSGKKGLTLCTATL